MQYLYHLEVETEAALPGTNTLGSMTLEFTVEHDPLWLPPETRIMLPAKSGWFDEAFVEWSLFEPVAGRMVVYIKPFKLSVEHFQRIDWDRDFKNWGWRDA